MNPTAILQQALREFVPTELASLNNSNPPCKCCGAVTTYLGEVDFNRSCMDRTGARVFPASDVWVPYWKCNQCGFIFTNFIDDWSDADFEQRIYNSDYIKVDPPIPGRENVPEREKPGFQKGKRLSALIQGSQKLINVLDYGAGGNPGATGLALIEDGFNVRSYEPHRAKGTDAERLPDGEYQLIIAIEVFEHCQDLRGLVAFMDKHLARNGMILIQTLLHPHPAPADILESRYIAPRNGHVSIFTLPALGLLFASARINIVQNMYGIFGFKSLPEFPNAIFFRGG